MVSQKRPKKVLSPGTLAQLKIRKEAADLLQDFITWTSDRPSPHFVFRGQGQNWPLIPTIGRDQRRYKPEIERQLLTVFKRLGRQYPDSSFASNDWEWLAIAQHYGLPTRLLDWTSNALVAAYFAAKGTETSDGIVAAVSARRIEFIDIEKIDIGPLDIDSTCFFYPPLVAARISSQRGLFSAHPDPAMAFKPDRLSTFEFPGRLKPAIIRLLHRLGFDEHQMMGGLDGVASTLKWRVLSGMALES
jgi:FRG domain